MTTKPILDVFIEGVPATAGSKRHVGHGILVDSCKRQKPWTAMIVAGVRDQWNHEPLTGSIELRLTFSKIRPKGHFGTGRNADRVKQSAPRDWITRPDGLKMARLVEDALTGIVWRDDSQIVHEVWWKIFSARNGVWIHARERV